MSSPSSSAYSECLSRIGHDSDNGDSDPKSTHDPDTTNLPSSGEKSSPSSTAGSSTISSVSSVSSNGSQTSNFECPLTSYTFSLTPGTDLTTLGNGSELAGSTSGASSASFLETMANQTAQYRVSATSTGKSDSGFSPYITSGGTNKSAASVDALIAASQAMVTAQPLCVP